MPHLIERRFGETSTFSDQDGDARPFVRMLSHRTHRTYSDRVVDDGLLQLLMACALSAPSKSDLQQADIIQVKDPEKRAAFARLIPSMPWIERAPVFLVFCGNGRRIRQVSGLRGETFANDHLDAFFNASVDAAIVLATFIAAAEAAGLGCCPISVVRNHCRAVNELLTLPEHVFPVAGMCVGWPDKEGHVSHRLPLEVTTHVDAFDETGFEDLIDAYDRRRAAAMPESDRYFWSEAKAKQYSQPQRTDFGAYIRDKGFDLS
ncbi:MAG: nitroreductase family protein [Gammaproteobacteria bacterium]|nr:nitroreductase family protein [Gammaproteobacteria bacterium]